MDEKNLPPVDFKVESKGFYPVRQVEDFHLRGKKVIGRHSDFIFAEGDGVNPLPNRSFLVIGHYWQKVLA